MVTLHRAAYILAGDADALADGALALDDEGTVLALDAWARLRERFTAATVRTHAGVLLPGLVNAHASLELVALRGRIAGGAGLAAWERAVSSAKRSLDTEESEAALVRALDELSTFGTAALGLAASASSHDTREVVEALERRAITTRVIAPIGAPDRAHAHTLAPALHHADAATLRAQLTAARAQQQTVHAPVCIAAAERALVHNGTGPLTEGACETHPRADGPLDAWIALGLFSSSAPAAAAISTTTAPVALGLADARRGELDALAARGARAVFLPRETLHIHTSLSPLLEALAAGLTPALGTGGSIAAPSLDVLAEASALRARFSSVSPRSLLAACTAWSADALGLSSHGRLAEGTRPGVLHVALDAAATHHARPGASDPFVRVLTAPASARQWIVRPARAFASA